MENLFAERMLNTQKSFIREILKVTEDKEIISFAGGLPNPESFPVEELAAAAAKVFAEDGKNLLQYTTTEGYLPLRKFIAERYLTKGVKVEPSEILITNGSQQGLDLIGKVFLNKGDGVVIEKPGYLGAIQAFSIFEPSFRTVPLEDDGIDTTLLDETLSDGNVKLFYAVPNFQNPSGITYSEAKRKAVAGIAKKHNIVVVEDDPYGELRFMGKAQPSLKHYLPENTILLGSFSKVVSPGVRLGWVCARKDIIEKIVIAKQAADLHSNYLSQRIVYRYLVDNDFDGHIQKIKDLYKKQRELMVSMIDEHFPKEIKYTKPEGGMFLWITLPEGYSSMELFELAIKEKVAFVPGDPFYVAGTGSNTMRLNFSNSDEEKITIGIKRLAKVIKEFLKSKTL